MSDEKKVEWRKLEGKGVELVYRGEGSKVFVKMWFKGEERRFVYEGVLKFKEIKED